jgi:uncharacterized protein YjbI with pentapeptide repeats
MDDLSRPLASSLPPRPAEADRAAWRGYWHARGQYWRTEPEIAESRQAFLAERRVIEPNIAAGIYPFKGIKLTRADLEWLLSTHESRGMVGPVDWTDPKQLEREGLDLRGADLAQADLDSLPLSGVRGGLHGPEWGGTTTLEQRDAAAIHLERASAHYLRLDRAHLASAHLEGADLREVHFEGADMYGAHLDAKLPTDLNLAFFDAATKIESVILADRRGIGPKMADMRLNGLNLGTADWSTVKVFGDEFDARQRTDPEGRQKDPNIRLIEYRRTVRAYRQMSGALRDFGLNEEADRFAYRAQVCQRRVFRSQRNVGPYLTSWFLSLIAGYGYRPRRSFVTYGLVILIFTLLYLLNSQFASPHLDWQEALVLSVSSFHGRGFFSSSIQLGDTFAQLAAVEAFAGLIVEVTIIATFTQRFFAK